MQPISLMVFLMYWILLSGVVFAADTNLEERISGIASHSFNIILPVIEMVLSLNVLNWKDLVYPFTFTLCYALVAFSIHALSAEDWPYGFMQMLNDLNGGIKWEMVIGLWAGITFLVGLLFSFVMLLIHLRDRNLKKRGRYNPESPSEEMIIVKSNI
jgi:hypothetical protein